MMDKSKASIEIIAQLLPLAAFEGWSQRALNDAALNAGYNKTDAIRVFPAGAIDAVNAYSRQADALLLEQLQHYSLDTMKIRERIATAVRLRLSSHDAHPEALRKALALQAMPFYVHHALSNLYHTVDTIWYGIGDTSTDFNFYTKRLTLAGVYTTTRLFWLDDKTPGHNASWAFLDRRINEVMQFEKIKSRVKQWMKHPLPH